MKRSIMFGKKPGFLFQLNRFWAPKTLNKMGKILDNRQIIQRKFALFL